MTIKNTSSSSGRMPRLMPVMNSGLYVQCSRAMPSRSHAPKITTTTAIDGSINGRRRYTLARSKNSSGRVIATQAAIRIRYSYGPNVFLSLSVVSDSGSRGLQGFRQWSGCGVVAEPLDNIFGRDQTHRQSHTGHRRRPGKIQILDVFGRVGAAEKSRLRQGVRQAQGVALPRVEPVLKIPWPDRVSHDDAVGKIWHPDPGADQINSLIDNRGGFGVWRVVQAANDPVIHGRDGDEDEHVFVALGRHARIGC